MFISLIKKLKKVVFFLKLKKLANKKLVNIIYTKKSYKSTSNSNNS